MNPMKRNGFIIKSGDDMKCKVCPKEEMVHKKMDVPFWKNGELVIVEGVTGYECPTCGERVFDQETTRKILHTLNKKKAKRYIKTAVYSL